MGLFVLFAISLGAGLVLFDAFGSDQDDADPVDDAPTPEDQGRQLSFDGTDTLIGTEQADILLTDTPDNIAPFATEIFLQGGDDFAEIADGYVSDTPPTVYGGAGDDVLRGTSLSTDVVLRGGPGDDRIQGDINDRLQGDRGDDTLVLAVADLSMDSLAVADGGAGDDVIRAVFSAPLPPETNTSVVLRGGSGADRFEVTLDGRNLDPGHTYPLGVIDDFDPSLDSIEISTDPNDNRTIADTQVSDTTGPIVGTRVDFTVSDPNGPDSTARLFLAGVTGLNAADIINADDA